MRARRRHRAMIFHALQPCLNLRILMEQHKHNVNRVFIVKLWPSTAIICTGLLFAAAAIWLGVERHGRVGIGVRSLRILSIRMLVALLVLLVVIVGTAIRAVLWIIIGIKLLLL